ncbi:unnamed protein product [Bubo scandiacus]
MKSTLNSRARLSTLLNRSPGGCCRPFPLPVQPSAPNLLSPAGSAIPPHRIPEAAGNGRGRPFLPAACAPRAGRPGRRQPGSQKSAAALREKRDEHSGPEPSEQLLSPASNPRHAGPPPPTAPGPRRAARGADGAGRGSRALVGAGAGCERLPPSLSYALRLRAPSSLPAADRPEPAALYDVSGRGARQRPRCPRRWGGQRWPEPGVGAAAVADRKRRGQLGRRRGDSLGP